MTLGRTRRRGQKAGGHQDKDFPDEFGRKHLDSEDWNLPTEYEWISILQPNADQMLRLKLELLPVALGRQKMI